MKKIILLLCIMSLLFTGCKSSSISLFCSAADDEKMLQAEVFKIIKYEFYGEDEKVQNANGKIIGFGIYGNGEYESKENIKKIKIAYNYPIITAGWPYNHFKGCKVEFQVFEESQYIIVDDLKGKNYNWVEFKDNYTAILHIR